MQKSFIVSYYLYIAFTFVVFICGLFFLTPSIIIPHQLSSWNLPWDDMAAVDLTLMWAMANIAHRVLLATATGLLLILTTAYRKGETWSIVTADIAGFFSVALGLWTAVLISRKTGAFAPLIIVLSMLILYAAALLASFDISRNWHIISGFFHRKDRHVPPVAHGGV